MIRASIDIGSNSVLLLAVEWNNKIEKELLNFSHITSLGKDLDKNKFFHPDSMQATFEALEDYKNQLQTIGVDIGQVLVTATEAARVATNAGEFFSKIKREIGFQVQVISGEQEAYFTALGVVSDTDRAQGPIVVMDIGGASTELIKIHKDPFQITSSISLPVGSVRATDWKISKQFDQKMQEVLSASVADYETDTMICVAGSMTSLATMFLEKTEFNDKEIEGLIISIDAFRKFRKSIENKSASELQQKFPFLGKRAPMVSAGAEIALLILEKLKVKKLQVSTRGLRYGLVFQGHL